MCERSVGGSQTGAETPLTSQAIGVLLRNQLYAGIVDVTGTALTGWLGQVDGLRITDLTERRYFRLNAIT